MNFAVVLYLLDLSSFRSNFFQFSSVTAIIKEKYFQKGLASTKTRTRADRRSLGPNGIQYTYFQRDFNFGALMSYFAIDPNSVEILACDWKFRANRRFR